MEVAVALIILVIAVLVIGAAPTTRRTADAREAEMRARLGVKRPPHDGDRL